MENDNLNLNFVQDFVHTCNECDLKYASKEALTKHKQQVHTPKPIEISINKIESTNKYPSEKLPSNATQLSPQHKLLSPSTFSLTNIAPMFTSEALNLSISQSTENVSCITQISPMAYKTHSIKKSKVPPNANGEFECTECHKAFSCRSSLSNHIKSHFNLRNKPFSCEDCKQGFMSQISYQEHRKSQCPKLYGANAAESNILSSLSNQATVYSMSGTSPTPASSKATCCMHCNSAFPDRSLLEDHAAKEHSNECGEVMCIRCTRSFATYMALRVHVTKSHGGPNGTPLKSHLSTNNTNDSQNITQSPISTVSERPQSNFQFNHLFSPLMRHTCQTCKKDFSTAQALGNHKRACGSPIFNDQRPVDNLSLLTFT